MIDLVLKEIMRRNILRRPLWPCRTAEDFLDLSRLKVNQKIENGEFPWVFDMGLGKYRRDPRILAASVVEQVAGPIQGIGATKSLKMPEVINLILPPRDVRSTELKRVLSCGSDHMRRFASDLKIARKPTATGGPNTFTVFERASVAKFLEKRRIA